MPTVNYTLRLDETDKKTAELIFNQLGLTLSAGLNIYLKTVARQKKIPFVLDLNENADILSTNNNIAVNKEKSFRAIKGILTGHEIDLKNERTERILSK